MGWIWSNGGGGSLFDPYSLYHIVFFLAITIVFYPVFRRKVWAVILSISVLWEILEHWITQHILWFPYVGNEGFINKCIGDPISNFIGFIIAIYFIEIIRRIKDE